MGEIEKDNFIFFAITIMSVINSYFGFVGVLIYFLYAFYKKKTRKMLLPVIYLSINTVIANFILFQGIDYFQFFSIFTFLLCLIARTRSIKKLSKTIVKNPWLVFLYLGIIMLSIIRVGNIRGFFSLILLTLSLAMMVEKEDSFKGVCDDVLIAGNQIVYLGVVEFALQRTFFYSSWTGSERYRYGIIRIGSTVSDPNYMCLMLVPLILLAYYMLKKYRNKRYRICFWMYIAICVISMSRTGLLCMILAIYFIVRKYYFCKMKKNAKIIMNTILMLTVVGFLYELLGQFIGTSNRALISSNFTRNVSIQYGLQILKQNLWTGIGMNKFYDYAQPLFYRDYGGHFAEGMTVMNMPLEISLAFGLGGLIIFVLLNVGTCIKARKDKEFPGISMLACFWAMALTLDGMTIGLFWIMMILPIIHTDIKEHRIIRAVTPKIEVGLK